MVEKLGSKVAEANPDNGTAGSGGRRADFGGRRADEAIRPEREREHRKDGKALPKRELPGPEASTPSPPEREIEPSIPRDWMPLPEPPARGKRIEMDLGSERGSFVRGSAPNHRSHARVRSDQRSCRWPELWANYESVPSGKASRCLSQTSNRGHSARILSIPARSAIKGP